MKIAFCFGLDDKNRAAAAVAGMANAMLQAPGQTVRTLSFDRGCLAFIETFEKQACVDYAFRSKNGRTLLISGLPLARNNTLEKLCDQVMEADQDLAIRLLSEMDGAYIAVLWDETLEKLSIVSDPLGLQPFYLHHSGSCFLAASEYTAIVRSGLVSTELDLAAFGQLVGMGHFLGNHTAFTDVERISPATIIDYTPRDNTHESKQYWKWESKAVVSDIKKVDTQGMVDSIEYDIKRYAACVHRHSLLLSGGPDSRLILAILLKSKIPVGEIKTFRHRDEKDDIDCRLAIQLAKRFKLPYGILESIPDFYSSKHYFEYIEDSEIATQSPYLFIAQAHSLINKINAPVWDGLCTGYSMKAVRSYPGEYDAYMKKEFVTKASPSYEQVPRIFSKAMASNIREGYKSSLLAERNKYSDDDHGLFRFVITNRGRNRTSINPLKVYSNNTLSMIPGSSRDLMEIASQISFAVRDEIRLQMEVFRRHFPECMKVPFVSGGEIYSLPRHDRYFLFDICRKTLGWRVSSLLGLCFAWPKSTLIERVVKSVEPDLPGINPDQLLQVKKLSPNLPDVARCWNLLFYWQLWNWQAQGALRQKVTEIMKGSGAPGWEK